MTKYTPINVNSGFQSTTAINQNFQAIQTAINSQLDRNAIASNAMNTNIDMNSNRIINLPAPLSGSDAARWSDITASFQLTGKLVPALQNGYVLSNDGTNLVWTSSASFIASSLGQFSFSTNTLSITGGSTNVDMNLAPKGTGSLNVQGTSTTKATVKLYEQTSNGTNYIGLTVPSSISADVTWTLPTTLPTLTSAPLVSNTSGVLSAVSNFDLQGSNSKLVIRGNSSSAASIDLYEDTDNGTNKLTITPSQSMTADRTATFPDADVVFSNSGFSAYMNTGTSCNTGTATKLLFDSVLYNNGGYFNTTTSVFQPTLSGVYYVLAYVKFNSMNAAGDIKVSFYKNGFSSFNTITPCRAANIETTCLCAALVFMNGTTDTLEIYATQNGGGTESAISGFNDNMFQAWRLSL